MADRFEFFELKTAADLFRKLESDYAALEDTPKDSCRAFNFFVTALHLPDWLYRREERNKLKLFREHAILRIVSHIANGAKHFYVNDGTNKDRHKSVKRAFRDDYVEEGYVEPGHFFDGLLIELTPDEATRFGTPCVDALTLGRQVLDFWRPRILATYAC